ncbi:MAG: GntR family transcriptional regulator [Verrucomicrobiae bacterium]|nr:GntR family transcriptional regulator [Verrucomicrobiae bacterium]
MLHVHARKHEAVAAEIRRLIRTGKFGADETLPDRSHLITRFRVSRATLQMAFDILIGEGTVRARRKGGTTVCPRTPGSLCYGLVFPGPVPKEHRSHYWTMLQTLPQSLASETFPRITAYYPDLADPHRPTSLQLESDIRNHKLDGLIFTGPVPDQVGTLPVETSALRCVSLLSEPLTSSRIPVVSLDWKSLIDRALTWFKSRGRKRVATLILPGAGPSNPYIDSVRLSLQKHGYQTPSCWVQGIHPDSPGWAREVVKLMMMPPARQRPDALFITDDTLVDEALAGLLESGLKIPSDLEVVAHCNFPVPGRSLLPVVRLGYDIPAAFHSCLELLRRPKDQNQSIKIPAQFESEYKPNTPR